MAFFRAMQKEKITVSESIPQPIAESNELAPAIGCDI